MSYKINKTNGDLLVEIADGQIDTTSTDITLIGKNYKGFGELFNENFVALLENFASTAAPSSPIEGQLWYDASQGRLKIYDGSVFKANGPIISNTRPDMVAGDIWIDNDKNQLWFFDGTDDVLVGPEYTSGQGGQGKTGFEVQSVIDISLRERVILKLLVGGSLFGVIAKEEFRLSGANKIAGYPEDPNDTVFPARQLFLKGFNFVDSSYWYQGTAANARALVDEAGVSRTAANFLPTDAPGETTDSITIKDAAGLNIGIDDTVYTALKIVGTTSTLEAQQSGTDIAIKTRTGNQSKDAIYIDASADRIGVYTNAPAYTFDVTGSLRTTGNAIIEGNLTVEGDTTYFNTATLQVEDKNIELSISEGAAAGNDNIADGGGIILKSSDSDKTILWIDGTNCWTFNQSIDLNNGLTFRIDDTLVLSETTLGNTVQNSSLTNFGTVVELQVDDIYIDANKISTDDANSPLDLIAGVNDGLDRTGERLINVNDAYIINLLDPSEAQDAATKQYVDDNIAQERIVFSLDITGFSIATVDTDVKNVLQDLYPASTAANGKIARIHCTSYESVPITGIDIEGAMNKSYISVMTDDSSSTSVLQDIAFSTASGISSPVPVRTVRTYRIESGSWVKFGVTETYTP